jgi:hypothetical protein
MQKWSIHLRIRTVVLITLFVPSRASSSVSDTSQIVFRTDSEVPQEPSLRIEPIGGPQENSLPSTNALARQHWCCSLWL